MGLGVVVVMSGRGGGEVVVLGNNGRNVIHGVLKVALEHARSAVDMFDIDINLLLAEMPGCFLLLTLYWRFSESIFRSYYW
eukprot:14629932-Heterocapsa_arctica.AAC.1